MSESISYNEYAHQVRRALILEKPEPEEHPKLKLLIFNDWAISRPMNLVGLPNWGSMARFVVLGDENKLTLDLIDQDDQKT